MFGLRFHVGDGDGVAVAVAVAVGVAFGADVSATHHERRCGVTNRAGPGVVWVQRAAVPHSATIVDC